MASLLNFTKHLNSGASHPQTVLKNRSRGIQTHSYKASNTLIPQNQKDNYRPVWCTCWCKNSNKFFANEFSDTIEIMHHDPKWNMSRIQEWFNKCNHSLWLHQQNEKITRRSFQLMLSKDKIQHPFIIIIPPVNCENT